VAARVRPTAVAGVVAGSAFPARLAARVAHTLPVATLRRLLAAVVGLLGLRVCARPGTGLSNPAYGQSEALAGPVAELARVPLALTLSDARRPIGRDEVVELSADLLTPSTRDEAEN